MPLLIHGFDRSLSEISCHKVDTPPSAAHSSPRCGEAVEMEMKLRFLAVILFAIVGAQAEFECSPRKSSEGPLPPVLPKSFHMVYEKNDKLSGTTKFYDIWYDWLNQKARVDEVADGKGRVLLFDFSSAAGFAYDVPRPGTDEMTDERSFLCEFFKINAESSDLYFYNPKEKPLRMVDIYQALLFGGPFRYAYTGTAKNSTRFIDTNIFEGCVQDYQTGKSMEISYYWTVEGADTPEEFVKPVMCERKGENLHELLSIIRFDRDPDFSPDTFKVPRHMDCAGFPVVSDAKELPSISDDFAWREEALTYSKDDEGVIHGDVEESYREIWVADQYKLARLDWTPKASEAKDTFLESYAGKPLTLIADINYGALFITTNNNGRCVVQPLTDEFPLSKKVNDKFALKKAVELLGLDGPRIMKGEYLERGNPVIVYSSEYKINANDDFTTLHETTLRFDLQQAVDSYGAFEFLPVSQLTRRIASDPENVMEAKIGIDQRSYFRYRSEHHPLHVFAAPGCVVHHKRRRFELRFASSTWDVISKRKNIFLDSLRREIFLRGEFDTVMRVHDVDVIEDSDVIARMTLLEPLEEITSKNSVTVDEAAKHIAAVVDEGHMAVPLEFEDGDQLLALENTFKEVVAGYEAAPLSRSVREVVEKSVAEAGSGYSLGSFIGICFGAFVLGVGCGFLIIYIKLRAPQSSTPDEVPLGEIEQSQPAGDPNRPGPSGWRQNQAQIVDG